MFLRYSRAFYIISALSISAAIQPALADAEAEARAKDNDDPSVERCVDASLLTKEESEKAIADCAKVVAQPGHSKHYRAYAYREIGRSQSELGLYQQALDSLSKSLELNPSDEVVYIARGDVYKKLHLTNKAASDYEKLATGLPVGSYLRAIGFQKLAILYNDDGQYDLAIAYANKAIELDPDEYNYYKNRGTIWLNKGDSERARADFARAIDLKSKR